MRRNTEIPKLHLALEETPRVDDRGLVNTSIHVSRVSILYHGSPVTQRERICLVGCR